MVCKYIVKVFFVVINAVMAFFAKEINTTRFIKNIFAYFAIRNYIFSWRQKFITVNTILKCLRSYIFFNGIFKNGNISFKQYGQLLHDPCLIKSKAQELEILRQDEWNIRLSISQIKATS